MTSSKKKFLDNRHLLIRKTIKEKMVLYHKLCNISNFLLRKYNPCKFSKGTCDGLNKISCCIECKYLIDGKGCTVKALQCRLYLCYDVREDHLHEQLGKLQSIASVNNLVHYRESAEYTEHHLRLLEAGD